MYAVRRNAPMHYVVRAGLPSEGPTTANNGAGAFRYVLAFGDGETPPRGYSTLNPASVLVVDRNLEVTTHAL